MEYQDSDGLDVALDGAATEPERLAALLARVSTLEESDPSQALACANEALRLAERLDDVNATADGLRMVAVLSSRAGGDAHGALDQLERARSLYERLDNLKGVASSLSSMGVVWHTRLDNASTALKHHQAALSLFERLGDRAGIARVRGSIATAYHWLGEYDKALGEYEASRVILEQLGDVPGVANRTQCIGDTYKRLGEYQLALDRCEQAAALYAESGHRRGVADVMWSLGNLHRRTGSYGVALEHLHRARTLYDELGDERGVANVAASAGSVHFSRGEYFLALDCYEQALVLFEKLGNHRAAAVSGNLGAVYARLGEHAKALEQFQAALASAGDEPAHAAMLSVNIGAAYGQLGDDESALEHCRQGLSLFRKIGDRPGIAHAMEVMGDIQTHRGEFASALEQYRAALALNEELGDRSGIGSTIGGIGSIFAEQRFEGFDAVVAVDHLQRAIGVLEEVGTREYLWELHLKLAELYAAEGNWMESHQHLATAHALKDELQSIEAHKKVEQLAHLKRIAEMEKLRAIERAQEQAARETLAVRAELLEAHLERQRSELAAQAIHLARQCELLGAFRDELRAIMRDASDPVAIVKRFAEKLRDASVVPVDWARFDAEFRSTYPDFQSKLVQRYPELTGMEIRVCALLKLRLSSSDIARILCISERSVEGHRYHIRKRIGIEKGQDIMEVIGQI